MKITFGMIAFQAVDTLPEGMLKANLDRLLNFKYTHEVIVVEGATRPIKSYWDGDASVYTNNGKSTDGTRELLSQMAAKHPKLKVILADDFWDGKTQMCNRYASIAEGDYIWQVDADEFYLIKDMLFVCDLLMKTAPDEVHFRANHFFGDMFNIISKDTEHLWGNDIPWVRIFRRQRGGLFERHEPPIYGASKEKTVINANCTDGSDVRMFHYSCVTRKQAEFKSNFFKRPEYVELYDAWQKDHSTRLINHAVTEPFKGVQPDIGCPACE